MHTYLLVSFFSGFSLMVVELTASRILAPLLGSSVYTWTAVIGTVLLGMSLGNVLGGYIIDKWESKKVLAMVFFSVFLTTAPIPLFAKYSEWLILLDVALPVKVTLVSFFIFLLPSVFYGMIYPGLLKFHLRDIGSTGRKAGGVSALWSLGSIIGTFLTGFFFIGHIGSTKTILLMSIVMLIGGLVIDFPQRKIKLATMIFSIPLFFVGISLLSVPKNSEKLLFFKESDYYTIKIADIADNQDKGLRMMVLDYDFHSVESDGDLDSYPNVYPIFSILKDDVRKIAVVGGGSNLISKNLADFYVDAKVTTVEIDPEVSKVAEAYFKKSSNPVEMAYSDGRMFFQENKEEYDLVFLDAYNSLLSVPWHLTTSESNELIKGHLSDGGILGVNMISAIEGDSSLFFQSMLKTLKHSFPNLYVLHYGKDYREVQNVVIIGVNSEKRIGENEIKERLGDMPGGNLVASKLMLKTPEISEDATLLTDDFAPLERLMLPAIKAEFKNHSHVISSYF